MADPEIATDAAVTAVGLRHKIRLTDPAEPLIFMVHGKAGNYDVMWTFRRAVPEHFNIIAPQAPLPDPLGGFSWWNIQPDGRREIGAAQSAAGLLRSFISRCVTHYALTPPVLLATGFSQGAGLLSVILQQKDNPLDGAALLAGFVIREHTPEKGKTRSVLMLHGTRDETVPVDLARTGCEHLKGMGYPAEMVTDPVGHKIGPSAVRALKAWIESFEK